MRGNFSPAGFLRFTGSFKWPNGVGQSRGSIQSRSAFSVTCQVSVTSFSHGGGGNAAEPAVTFFLHERFQSGPTVGGDHVQHALAIRRHEGIEKASCAIRSGM